MARLIDKDALVAEINQRIEDYKSHKIDDSYHDGLIFALEDLRDDFIDTLEVKELDEQKERMSECPYRQVGCTMYEGKILECNGACSWVVDYPKLKELKAQKGE